MLPPTHTEIPLIQTSKKIKNVFTCDIVHSGILHLELFYTFQIKAITKCCILSFWLTRTSSICWICLWTCFQKWLYALRMLDIFKGWLDVDNCIWDNKIMAFLCFCLCQSRYVVRSPPKSCYHFLPHCISTLSLHACWLHLVRQWLCLLCLCHEMTVPSVRLCPLCLCQCFDLIISFKTCFVNIFLLVSQSLLAFLVLDYFLIDDCFQCTDDEKIHFICRLQSANHVLETLQEILILEILKYRILKIL